MAKPWSEMLDNPKYQALSENDKIQVKNYYFKTVIAPEVPEAQREQVREYFFATTPLTLQDAAEKQKQKEKGIAIEKPKTPPAFPKTSAMARANQIGAPIPEKVVDKDIVSNIGKGMTDVGEGISLAWKEIDRRIKEDIEFDPLKHPFRVGAAQMALGPARRKAAGAAVAGLAGMAAGGLTAMGDLMLGRGYDYAGKSFEKVAGLPSKMLTKPEEQRALEEILKPIEYAEVPGTKVGDNLLEKFPEQPWVASSAKTIIDALVYFGLPKYAHKMKVRYRKARSLADALGITREGREFITQQGAKIKAAQFDIARIQKELGLDAETPYVGKADGKYYFYDHYNNTIIESSIDGKKLKFKRYAEDKSPKLPEELETRITEMRAIGERHAKEAGKTTEPPGPKERVGRQAEEPIRVRDIEKDRVEAKPGTKDTATPKEAAKAERVAEENGALYQGKANGRHYFEDNQTRSQVTTATPEELPKVLAEHRKRASEYKTMEEAKAAVGKGETSSYEQYDAAARARLAESRKHAGESGEVTVDLGKKKPPKKGETIDEKYAARQEAWDKGEAWEPGNEKIKSDYEQGKKKAKPSLYTNTKETLKKLGTAIYRDFKHLPRGERFAALGFKLRTHLKQRYTAAADALTNIEAVTEGLKPREMEVFSQKLIYDNVWEIGERNSFKHLPEIGDSWKALERELAEINKIVDRSPKIQRALARRETMLDVICEEWAKWQDAVGNHQAAKILRTARQQNKKYFHRIVMDYIDKEGLWGTGQKFEIERRPGYTKRAKGGHEFLTDYFRSEHEVVSHLLYDTERAKVLKYIDDNFNIIDELRARAKAHVEKNYPNASKIEKQRLIGQETDRMVHSTEGYTVYVPKKGDLVYSVDALADKAVRELQGGTLESLEIKVSDLDKAAAHEPGGLLRKAKAIGGKERLLVIPDEVARTMAELYSKLDVGDFAKINRKVLNGWKKWQIISPKRFPKFNIRNFTGDIDAVLTIYPKAAKNIFKAARELGGVYFKGKPATGLLKKYFDRGGPAGTLQVQEMGLTYETPDLLKFKELIERPEAAPKYVWNKWFNAARTATDWREQILRYAAFESLVKEMKANKGRPKSFLSSMPEEVMALDNIYDRAYMMSNDLLGAYDRVGVAGQFISSYWYPFYRWKEVNFRRYLRAGKNFAQEGRLMSALGRGMATKLFIRGPYMGARALMFLTKASAMFGAAQGWNYLMFPEAEKKLSESNRNKPHFIIHVKDNGEPILWSRFGAFPDILETFGLDVIHRRIEELWRGEKNAMQVAKETVKEIPAGLVNSAIQGSRPFEKLAAETYFRQSTYPDVRELRTIHERGLYIARHFGLAEEYRAITKLPNKPYFDMDNLGKTFYYTEVPMQSAYWDTIGKRIRYMRELGKIGEGYIITDKSNALYHLRAAIRMGDKAAAVHYDKVYRSHGGTDAGMKRSLQSMHPLAGMIHMGKHNFGEPTDLGWQFLNSLNKDEFEKAMTAIEYYKRLMSAPRDYLERDIQKTE